MTGRPRLLDDAKCREICALISVGCKLDVAAFYVGCNAMTVRREAQRNPDFHQKFREAQIAARIAPLKALRNAAHTHWRAAAWFLERTHPHEFGRRGPGTFTSTEFSAFVGKLVAVIQEEIGDNDVLQRIVARLDWMISELDEQIEAAHHPLEKKPREKKPVEQKSNARHSRSPQPAVRPPGPVRPLTRIASRHLKPHQRNGDGENKSAPPNATPPSPLVLNEVAELNQISTVELLPAMPRFDPVDNSQNAPPLCESDNEKNP